MATTTPAYRPKTQAERDDDIRYRDKFRDGPNDEMPTKQRNERKSFIKQFMDDMKRKYNPTDSKVKSALEKAGV